MEMTDYQVSMMHSLDRYDEASLTDKFPHYIREERSIRDPQDLEFSLVRQDELFSCETLQAARDIFLAVLKNESTESHTNVELVNSGSAIHTLHHDKSIREAIEEARESIESGRAYQNLMNLLKNQ